MMRADAVRKVGGYDESFDVTEDLDLFLRLAEVGRLANLPRCVGRYRLHAGGISEVRRQHEKDMCKVAAERAAQRRGVPCRFEAHDDWRPGRDAASRHRYALRYGWWAYNSGERVTAMIYGLKAVALRPWIAEGWKLLTVPLFRSVRRSEVTA